MKEKERFKRLTRLKSQEVVFQVVQRTKDKSA